MKRHARSENRKIVRKLCDPGQGETAEAAAEIGSRVFPLRTPPPASMPSVGTRRSTRVFVPKAAAKASVGDGGSARVLRSGKRFSLSKPTEKRVEGEGDEWLRVFGNSGDGADLRWWKGKRENGGFGERDGRRDELVVPEADGIGPEEQPTETIQRKKKLYGIVYCRKRQRSAEDDSSSLACLRPGTEEDRMYGIVFSRKQNRKKPKVTSLVEVSTGQPKTGDEECEEDSRTTGTSCPQLRIRETAKNFAWEMGISEADLWTSSDSPVALAVLVESSRSHNSYRFPRLFIPIMRWMRRARVRLWDLAAFLLSGSVASVFSLNGIHFLPFRPQKKNSILLRNSFPGCGLCEIYGAKELVPLLSLNFSALPSYFKGLHAAIILRSQFFPGVFSRGSLGLHETRTMDLPDEEYDDNVPAETGFSGTDVTVSETPAVMRNEINELPSGVEASVVAGQTSAAVNGSRFKKHQRKRSSLRNSRASRSSSMNSRIVTLHSAKKGLEVSPAAKAYSLRNSLVEPVRVKLLESCLTDLFDDREESDVASSGSHSKQRKSARKCPVEKIKELKSVERIKEQKSALAEVKQNIDSVRCNANILVTVADRCWREDGAEVMLEMLGSNEWCIAVKTGDNVRFLHKPQDMRPCVVNRYTHAYMWTGEEGWKLEFCDKWDWFVFKELHLECRERNMQDVSVKIIPVPGVREVSGYEDNATPSFVRPDLYIHMMDDEVGRALASETACYDMDSADEEWLRHLNSNSSDAEGSDWSHLSEDNFERIIFTLEKDAYNHPDSISNKDRALDLCQSLGHRDMLVAVYDYWLKKRNKKRTTLVKVFQGPPSRRAQLLQKPFLRKKRSLKRQRSQAGRGKPDFFLEAEAKQEALRKVQEAESAAGRSAEAAIHLRSRAQVLMANADLSAYRAAMALRIAEAARLSDDSPDLLNSSILFD